MRLKKVFAYMLSALLIGSAPCILLAKTEEKSVLTLEQAIKDANNNSIKLRTIRRNSELNKETLNQMWNEGELGKKYQQLALDKEYDEKNQKVIEESNAYQMTNLFDNILLNQKKHTNLLKSIALQKKQIRKLEIEEEKGMQSKLELSKEQLELRESVDRQITLETTIKNQYASINSMMGVTSTKEYNLQKPAQVYKPFELKGTLDGFISSKAEQHLSVWKATEDISVSKMIDMESIPGGNYVAYLQQKNQAPQAEDNKQSTKEGIKESFRAQYNAMIQLEEQYITKQEALKVAEKEFKSAQIYYDNGFMAKLEYDTKSLAYENLKLDVEQITNEHEQIKAGLENPNLLK